MMIYKRTLSVFIIVNIGIIAFSQTNFKEFINSINWNETESEFVYKFHDILQNSKREVWESENSESNYCFKDLKIANIPIKKSYIRVNRNNKEIFRLNFIILDKETDLSLYSNIESSLIRDFGIPIKSQNDLIWSFEHYKMISTFFDFSNRLTPEIEEYTYAVNIEPIQTFYVDWSKGIVTSNNNNHPIPQIEYFRTDNDNNVFYKEVGKKERYCTKNKTYNTPKGLVISFDGGMFCYRSKDNDIVFIKQGISITYPIKKSSNTTKLSKNTLKMIKVNTLIFACIIISACSNNNNYKSTQLHETSSQSSTKSAEVQTSAGYTPDKNYEPTIDRRGNYHTIDGKAKQIQYQGSREQQRDLDMIDEYMRNNPDF